MKIKVKIYGRKDKNGFYFHVNRRLSEEATKTGSYVGFPGDGVTVIAIYAVEQIVTIYIFKEKPLKRRPLKRILNDALPSGAVAIDVRLRRPTTKRTGYETYE